MSARKSEDFRQILERLAHRHDTRRVFDGFVHLAACALSAQTREAEYLEEAKHWQKPELDLFAEAFGALILEMESKPFEDILGSYYLEFAVSTKGQQRSGEFHTPKIVCDMLCGAPHNMSSVALVVMWRSTQLDQNTGVMSHLNAT